MQIGELKRDGLIAGDYPTEVQEVTLTGPVELKRGDVLGINADGVVALVDSTAADGTQNAIGIACDDITVVDNETAVSNMYIKGAFAKRHLRFGGTDTVDTHIRRMTEIGLIPRTTRI